MLREPNLCSRPVAHPAQAVCGRRKRAALAVFTNEQLAEMVRQRVATAAALAAIAGVGEARLARYGPAFVDLLAEGVGRLAPPSAPASD